jgi:insertion element IS1 protein InsB
MLQLSNQVVAALLSVVQYQPTCPHCKHSDTVKNGKSAGHQQYKCKRCSKRFQQSYKYRAYSNNTNHNIVVLTKENCGSRSTARLLGISTTTVVSRIKTIANGITLPVIPQGKEFEVDELRTYIKKKQKTIWVVLALEKSTKKVLSFNVGSRTNNTLKVVLTTLELSKPKAIFTDNLKSYRYLIDNKIHQTIQYGTNHVERANLSLRTNLKRLNRKTICFSKSATMLFAILKIYFWA